MNSRISNRIRKPGSESEYWRERELRAREARIRNVDEYNAELSRLLEDFYNQCQREIDAFYGRYAEAEGISIAEAKKRVSEIDIREYEKLAEEYVRTRNLSPQANEEMRLYNLTMKINRLEMLKARIGVESVVVFDQMDQFVREALMEEADANFKRNAGILGLSVPDISKINAIVNADFKNAHFSEIIWKNRELLMLELTKQLTSALVGGVGSRELARRLRKVFDVSKYEAERLMRTEVCRIYTESQSESYKEQGFEYYEYMANVGSSTRICDTCSGLNGKVFKLSDKIPGDNAPPMHPNCQCCITPWFEGIDD